MSPSAPAAMLQNAPVHLHNRVARLPTVLSGFFYPVERVFCCAAKNRENGAISLMVNRVITPFTSGNHATIHIEDQLKLTPVESKFGRAGDAKIGEGPLEAHACEHGI